MKLEPKPLMLLRHASEGSPSVTPRRMQSEALLGGSGELVIVHKGRDYRLRLTQNGKLILTA